MFPGGYIINIKMVFFDKEVFGTTLFFFYSGILVTFKKVE
jgi:hypothetical protein